MAARSSGLFSTDTREFQSVLTQVSTIFCIDQFHEEQEKAIKAFFCGNDIFVSLPTGYGKSLIYQSIPIIASILTKKPSTMFIISPLRALMQDQVQYLNGLNSIFIHAVALTEQTEEHLLEQVMAGEFTHVFGSPESFLAHENWRALFDSAFRDNLVGVAVDEAHCISHW